MNIGQRIGGGKREVLSIQPMLTLHHLTMCVLKRHELKHRIRSKLNCHRYKNQLRLLPLAHTDSIYFSYIIVNNSSFAKHL